MDRPKSIRVVCDRIVASPFEVFVASSCVIPVIATAMIMLGFLVSSALMEMSHIGFILLWGVLAGVAALLIWSGVIGDHVRPVIIGLRVSAFVWASYVALLIDNIDRLSGLVFVGCMIIAVIISLVHSSKLAARTKQIKKAVARITTEE